MSSDRPTYCAVLRRGECRTRLVRKLQYNTIMKTSIAPVSSAWPSSKALQAKTIRQKTEVQRKAIVVIKRSENQLTKEDTLGQKGAFLDVDENKSGIQKSG